MTAFGVGTKGTAFPPTKARGYSILLLGRKRHYLRNISPALLKQHSRVRLVPRPVPFLQDNRGGALHSPTVLLLPEYSCSWHFCFVTWGRPVFPVPGLICGSTSRSKALVIHTPLWVLEAAAMPEKQFERSAEGRVQSDFKWPG